MKIGFLAMSGVRVQDPDLVKLGLTLPGFVRRSEVIASLPSLGLLMLAAVTPPGHEILYFEAEGDLKEPAEVYECDLVAISTFSAQIPEAYAIADRLRARGVRVAMGGLHATVLPEETLEHVDYAVVGEGENVWPSVVEAAQKGASSAIFRAADFEPVDITRLPVPRYDLLAGRSYNRFTVQTSRGCPWRCDFCASTVMLSNKFRQRPVDQVIRDIHALRKIRPRPFLEFADDNTFVDLKWGKELCRALIPEKLKWFTETDVRVADDEELLDLMVQAGCRQVLVGLESPGAEDIRGIEMKTDFKARRASGYAEAIRKIQNAGITVNGCFVLGFDTHTPEIFERILQFVEEVPLYEVQITVLTPFPGTPLYDRFARENRLTHAGQWERCTLFDINYRPQLMSASELRSGLFYLTEKLYDPAAIERRRIPFHIKRRGQLSRLRSAQLS